MAKTRINPAIPATTPYPPGAGVGPSVVRQWPMRDAEKVARSLEGINESLNVLHRGLRTSLSVDLTALTPAVLPTLAAIDPISAEQDTVVPVTLTGTGFLADVATVATDNVDITVSDVLAVSDTAITATFTIAAAAALGAANVVVTIGTDSTGAISFTVLAPGGLGINPDPVTSITVSGFIDPISAVITLTIQVPVPAEGTGSHLNVEIPDQSSSVPVPIGTAPVGTAPVGGPWVPIDLGVQPYAAQPWTKTFPAPPTIDPTVDTPCRLYVSGISAAIDTPLVRAGLAGATPNQTFTLVSLASGSPTSGTNVTTLTGGNGTHIGIAALVLSPVNVSGKLQTPVLVTITDTPPNTPGWVARLVLTIGTVDPTLAASQQVVPGFITQAGPVYTSSADGISTPHSFSLLTPTAFTSATIWLQAGLVDSGGNHQWNNIVPGITPSWPISYGSTTGTTDAASIMAASIAATMAIVGGLFGVAALGVTNPYLGAGAVATLNIQALAVTNPILAALAVDAAKLASSSVTSTKIANLAVGTAAIQLLAVDTSIIANLAVSTGKIINLAVTTAQLGFASVANANLGSAVVAQANIASSAIGSAQIQALAVLGAHIANATITNANLGSAIIFTANIADAQITTAKIADAQITSAKIVTLAIGQITGWDGASIAVTSGITFTTSGTSTVINGSSITANAVNVPLGTVSAAVINATSATFSNAPLRLSGYYFWVDSSSRLRIKASAPSSDTDGTIVGTQS